MKLFVWNDPYQVDWGGSCIYAVAETVEEARFVAHAANTARYGRHIEEKNSVPLSLGEPTRILDVPCAEIYEWSE